MKKLKKRESAPGQGSTISTPTSKRFSHEQLLDALYEFHREMETAMITFFLVGDTLKRVVNEKQLEGDTLHFGVRRKDMTHEAYELVKMGDLRPVAIKEDVLLFDYNGISIELQIFDEIEELKRLDSTVYCYEAFNIPNPYQVFIQKYG